MHMDLNLQRSNSRAALESMFRPAGSTETRSRGEKRNSNEVEKPDEESDDEQAHDEVRLWEDGFKDRYYESKFDVGPEQLEFR